MGCRRVEKASRARWVAYGSKWSVEICHSATYFLRVAWLPPAARNPSRRNASL
jgi:hypothetical protein